MSKSINTSALWLAQRIGRAKWIRLGIRRRLVSYWFAPLEMQVQSFETDFYGKKYLGAFDSVIDWCVYFFGNFAGHELNRLQDLAGIDQSKVFWDIGGNTGHHSLFMQGCCSRVHYFEPFPKLRDRFKKNVAANDLKNVRVHEFGLGEHEETLPYYASTSRNLGTGSFMASHAQNNVPSGEFLIRDGDSVCGEPDVEPPDIVKIDVEGFEFNVLRGLRETLKTYRPSVLMELTDSSLSHLKDGESISDFFPYDHVIQEIRPAGAFWVFFQKPQYTSLPFDPAKLGEDRVSQYLLITPKDTVDSLVEIPNRIAA